MNAASSVAQGIVIRRAEEADCAMLAALAGELGYANQASQIADRLAKLSQMPSSEHAIWVAQEVIQGAAQEGVQDTQGQLHGWAHVRAMHQLNLPSYAELVALVVAKGSKRQGIGQQLIAQVENWTQAQQLAELRLYSSMQRQAEAHQFYLRLGYQAVKQKMLFCKRWD